MLHSSQTAANSLLALVVCALLVLGNTRSTDGSASRFVRGWTGQSSVVGDEIVRTGNVETPFHFLEGPSHAVPQAAERQPGEAGGARTSGTGSSAAVDAAHDSGGARACARDGFASAPRAALYRLHANYRL